MGMIKIYAGKSKPAKKKPGWKEAEAEHQAWLKSVNSMSSGFLSGIQSKGRGLRGKKIDPVVVPVANARGAAPVGRSLATPGGSTGTRYVAPEVLYKESPEMLQRELAARERKFNAAPAYNKGGDVLMTDDMMADMMAGKLRRR
jgi:hypothetical protein